ncbi:MAG: DUF58 domain-containing protein [Polyangiaceae bacterium]
MNADARTEIRTTLDWGSLAPLRLRARMVAEGAYSGAHRSARRGAGVEFGGHREYVPGDDLRWLDRRSLLRHDRLQVRQFETETDRALRLVVDATASMGYRGSRALGAKLAYSALVAAALSRIAITGGDPVGVQFIGGDDLRSLPRSGGREQFERIVATLERAEAGGDARANLPMVEEALGGLARTARRGAMVVVLSDLLDLPEGASDFVCALAARGRVLVVVQVLDPDEVDFPFEGTLRVRALEGSTVVETDGESAREAYVARLAELAETWERALAPRGGRLVRAVTSTDPVTTVREIVAKLF